MDRELKSKREVVRIKGKLKEVVTIHDKEGKTVHKFVTPLMVEFSTKDALQVIVGATLLAVPISYTEEAWHLGQSLGLLNILGIYLVSILFTALFIFYHYYKDEEHYKIRDFYSRVFGTYILTLLVVGVVISLIGISTWQTDIVLTIKRIVIVSLPASMSAAVADVLK